MVSLDEFLAQRFPLNAWVEYPGFEGLYVRKGDIALFLDGEVFRCTKVFTVANVVATVPGTGAFARLVDDLLQKGWAVYVENAHNKSFAIHLERVGFSRVNPEHGPNFLIGHEGHLEEFTEKSKIGVAK